MKRNGVSSKVRNDESVWSFAISKSFSLEAGVTTVSYLIFSCCYFFRPLGGAVVSVLFCIRPDLSMGPETIYPATPGQRASHRTVSNAGTKPVIGNQYLSYAIPLSFFSFYHSFSACPLHLSSPSVSFSPHLSLSLSPSRYLSTNYVNGAKQPNH